MATQIYFEGDFYYAKAATTTGQSPTTHPAKWQKIEIPNAFRSPIVSLAAARLFAQEDNLEQSAAAEQLGRLELNEIIFDANLAPKAGATVSVTRS